MDIMWSANIGRCFCVGLCFSHFGCSLWCIHCPESEFLYIFLQTCKKSWKQDKHRHHLLFTFTVIMYIKRVMAHHLWWHAKKFNCFPKGSFSHNWLHCLPVAARGYCDWGGRLCKCMSMHTYTIYARLNPLKAQQDTNVQSNICTILTIRHLIIWTQHLKILFTI